MSVRSVQLPFENRWTNRERAWHWYLQLERKGIDQVRLSYALQERSLEPQRDDADGHIPSDFIEAWLTDKDKRRARRDMMWRIAVLLLLVIAALGASVAAWYSLLRST
jgi:hypothetical protein